MTDKNKIIDGKLFAESLRKKIAKEVSELKSRSSKKPGLAVILVGHDPASEVYVKNKSKQTAEVGMENFEYKLPETVSEKDLIEKINELNKNDKVHGILVQLPLPKHISELAVINAISPAKDVDGFHDMNRKKLEMGVDSLVPCTPLGCLMLIKDRLGNDLKGKKAVVVGRSNIVGKPMAQLLMNEGCDVKVCHSQTENNPQTAAQAEILVVAVGKPLLIKKDWVRQGACVIDVGINRITNGAGTKLVGDIDFNDVLETAGYITPVPGGVGPMTIACLLNNTLKAFKMIEGIN